ncbi:MAG: hypothetical protein V4858_02180 [Pseudomonadota bacterium]
MTYDSLLARSLACAVLGLGISAPSLGADNNSNTLDADVAELKRAFVALQAQNRALADRVQALEAEKLARQPATGLPAPATATAPTDSAAPAANTAATASAQDDDLARRVRELELSRMAQADATRSIIRDSMSKLGSKINQAVTLGGAIEVRTGKQQDFSGPTVTATRLSTAELDLEIQANPWSVAHLVMGYTDGSDVTFRNTQGFESGVDRFTVDTATITIGDLQRFPIYMKAGRMTLGFGSSTGVHRADVLSIESPLTTDAFETRRDAIGFGFGLPTPPLTRSPPPVLVPPVRPQVLAPLLGTAGRGMGYVPVPERPVPRTPVSFPPDPPPFYGDVVFYESHNVGNTRDFSHNVNGRLGYRTHGHCGKRYSEIRSTDLFCPWSLDVSVDYLSSVFDSRFLSAEYRPFLNQLGTVRGLASTLKMSLGPWQLVGEWNGATERAVFRDGAGATVSILPSAWQLAVGYQFDWNPWIEAVGAQGTYAAIGYSETRDLAGAIQLLNGSRSRVGALPYARWTLTAGEWVQEGLKLQLEYSRTTDYPVHQGGTGGTAEGLQMTVTYSW